MKILAFDSTAKIASVALAEEERLLAVMTASNGLTHSEILLPMAQDVCARAKTALSEMDYYAVTVGPGSFTGVRIGVATVKGLAFRMPQDEKKRCVAVSTLEALAQNLFPLDGIYTAVMDARRAEVYNALFEARDGALKRLTPDRAISLDCLAEELLTRYAGRPVRLVGDGYEIAYRTLVARGVALLETPLLLQSQNAGSVALCACRMIRRGETVSDRALAPVYLRLPQAERERLEKIKENKSE